jgi:sterol desaturase/sphingolipid hydroxylase (fatty acid hydroxylase superfamily)
MEYALKILGIIALVETGTVFIVAERLFPAKRQAILRRNWHHDLSYWVLNRLLVQFTAVLFAAGAFYVSTNLMPGAVTSFVGGLPLWAGIPLAILVADLVFYSMHRLAHKWDWLWQFHAVHHSIEDMDWLASVRVHPCDQLLTTISGICVQIALGFDIQAILVAGLVYSWQGHLVHSNLRIRFGPLRWLIAGPAFHHWHHSASAEDHNKNFAGQLPFLDWIFGTAHFPNDHLPEKFGIDERVPAPYVDGVLYPFKRLVERAGR